MSRQATAIGSTAVLVGLLVWRGVAAGARADQKAVGPVCPPEMVRVAAFCIDRWEVSTIDAKTRRPLSPYYPPEPRLLERIWNVWQNERADLGAANARRMPLPDLPSWQTGASFSASAVSRPNVVPQAYLSRELAARVCANAGKRLCSALEWTTACRGQRKTRFPYGEQFQRSKCNVYRLYHPGAILHGTSSIGLTDPRLNLVFEGERPLLELTGANAACASHWGADAIFDMVGNLDEWVSDEPATFLGGFYARAATKGCDTQVSSHSPSYYDYSTGTRCCRAPTYGAE